MVAAVTEENMFVISRSRRCVMELWVQHSHETWPVFLLIFCCDLALFMGERKLVFSVIFFFSCRVASQLQLRFHAVVLAL